MTKPKPPIARCAGAYDAAEAKSIHAECQTCQRHLLPVLQRNTWIAPPYFIEHCPEKIQKGQAK